MRRFLFCGTCVVLFAMGQLATAGEPWTSKIKAGEDDPLKLNFGGRIMVDYNFADEELWEEKVGNGLALQVQ